MRVHVLGLPHTQTSEEFTTCAFTMKAFNLCRMLTRRGHEVIHYGVEGSNPECTKNVTVMPAQVWRKYIGGHPGRNFYNHDPSGKMAPYHAMFAHTMKAALQQNAGPRFTEIVCQTWGGAQRTACDGLDQYLVESGIGYPNSWAEFRVYESHAWLHMHLGRDGHFGGGKWYWVVIPNAFDLKNFTPAPGFKRGEDFLYIGRLNEDKGVSFAIQVAKEVGRKITIVGQGDPTSYLAGNPHVTYLPPVGIEERRTLMAQARAVFCLTQYVEPFCGVNVEAQLSGTPVITSDFGVFPETVIHGVTGFRGRTMEQWVWAAQNIDRIDGRACAHWASENYSLERVALMYEDFFQQVLNVRDRDPQRVVTEPTGFYARHPGRTQLDCMVRRYPQAAADIAIDLQRPHEAPALPPQPADLKQMLGLPMRRLPPPRQLPAPVPLPQSLVTVAAPPSAHAAQLPAIPDSQQAHVQQPCISFVMRVHNEQSTLQASIDSLMPLVSPIEIIVVLHRCTDDSKRIALACMAAAPPRHRIKVFEYDVPLSRDGLEVFVTPEESRHSFVHYTNYAFSLASCTWKFKWDADHVATPSFVRWIDGRSWESDAPTVIEVNRRVQGPNGAVDREQFMFNCLIKYVQSNFWEVPSWPGGAAWIRLPDDVEFVHASTLSIPKAFWSQPPWFASNDLPAEYAAEAAEIRRRYARAVELVGPEPFGCARALNPECDAYQIQCMAARDQIFAEAPPTKFFLELGSGHCDTLYETLGAEPGWRGVTVEARGDLIARLAARDNVEKINAAILTGDDVPDRVPFYYVPAQLIVERGFPDWLHGCGSLHRDHAILSLLSDKAVVCRKVRAVGLPALLRRLPMLDLVKTDLEGDNFAVVTKLLDLGARPAVLEYEDVHMTDDEKGVLMARLWLSGYTTTDRKGDSVVTKRDKSEKVPAAAEPCASPGSGADCRVAPLSAPMPQRSPNLASERQLADTARASVPQTAFSSQAGQDRFVVAIAGGGRPGTFLDIGCGDAVEISNTVALERRGWDGILIDRDPSLAPDILAKRRSPFTCCDAALVNWGDVLNGRTSFDYLSFDVDGSALDVFRSVPWSSVRFRVLTVEHDAYRFGDTPRAVMREKLHSLGYELLCPDVMYGGLQFEDWWVDPRTVDMAAANKFRTTRPTEWRAIVDRWQPDTVNLRDRSFEHYQSGYCSKYGASDIMRWDRTCSQPGPTVYTDTFLNDDIVTYTGDKIAWLVEPRAMSPFISLWFQHVPLPSHHSDIYQWISKNHSIFVEIWSHDESVLALTDRGVFVPAAGSWVSVAHHKVAPKTRLCSFIASDKNFAPGHVLRNEVRRSLPAAVDAFGRGFRYVEDKADALRPYAYSIAVENSRADAYFTEKVLDCFLTGTVPIYCGTKQLGRWFDMNGVICFESAEQIQSIVQSLSMRDYITRLPAVRHNFETARRLYLPEEWGVRDSRVIRNQRPATSDQRPATKLTRLVPIPKLIHHIWIGSDLPELFQKFRMGWMRLHQSWSFYFWRDDAHVSDERVTRVLRSTDYSPVIKSDILRLHALSTMGGLYVDTDCKCLKPLDELLRAGGFHCGWEAKDVQLGTAVMACSAGHPLALSLLDTALKRLGSVTADYANAHPDKVVGPGLLTELSANAEDVTRHARDVFYPKIGRPAPSQSYVMHYWAGCSSAGWQKKANPADERAAVDKSLEDALVDEGLVNGFADEESDAKE